MVLMVLWISRNNKNNDSVQNQYEARLDSARVANDSIEEATIVVTEVSNDSLSPLFPALSGTEEVITLSNDVVAIGISTKGAIPSSARLNNYNDQSGKKVILFDKNEISLDFRIDGKNQNISTKSLFFVPVNKTENSVTMRLNTNGYGYMDIIYTLNPESYVLNMEILSNGMENFFSSDLNAISINWIQNLRQQEKGFDFEQRYTTLTYKSAAKKRAKILTVAKDTRSETIEESLDWVAFKNQFFSCILVSGQDFSSSAKLTSSPYAEGKNYMKKMVAKLNTPFDPTGKEPTVMQFYFGPNDYSILKSSSDLIVGDQKVSLQKVIDLGWPVVREFNRFVILPLFNLLSKIGLNMGLVILLLTIIVKILVYPFTYKSYISSAKMRALKPYVDEINAKYPKQEDAMKKQQETMAMYSKYGVSPMGGCLPSFIQMPIWMAFFFFVPNAIELRQESFLWAKDLTGFDDLISWGTDVWLIGDHLSIFCVLFCVSNVASTWFSMQQQQSAATGNEQTMKMMKWMMYLMPLVFFFTFNNYSSGLNYYYFISALSSVLIMIYLRRRTDEKALLAKLEANYEASRNDPTKRRQGSSMMARLEAMQKEQERLQQQQQQQKRK